MGKQYSRWQPFGPWPRRWRRSPAWRRRKTLPPGGDHPALQRFNGTVLVGQNATPFERISLELGPTDYDSTERRGRVRKSQTVEGRVWRSVYIAPGSTSTPEELRNYPQALKRRVEIIER